VFTARYALSPYIKQIRFVFKGLIFKIHEQIKVSMMKHVLCRLLTASDFFFVRKCLLL
jgi:hypothetical protein